MTTVALKVMIIVCHLFRFNWVCNRNTCDKILLFVRDWGRGNDPTSGCDFGYQVTKKVGKH